MDEYDEEMADMQGDNNLHNEPYDALSAFENPKTRIQKLKKEIEESNKKILQLNHGKGKWFDTDHKDFIKIYNKCGGIDKRIINEGIKILGMNQA